MPEALCKNCQYFLQHYTFSKRRIIRVCCGHCTFSRAKRKQPDAKACKNYIPGDAREDAFASKEYLSKELIQYMRSLELLPKIEEGG